MDRQNLFNAERTGGDRQAASARQLIATGHVHRAALTMFAGVATTICPAPNHAVDLDLAELRAPSFKVEPPAFHLHSWFPGEGFGSCRHPSDADRDFDGPHPFFGPDGKVALVEAPERRKRQGNHSDKDPECGSVIGLVAALALTASSGVLARAKSAYPDRPIRMIVPLAAASAVDVAARIVTQKMADNMGQQIVIVNQPGASGLIGAEQVARAEPDGYTIGGFNDSIMTMVPNLHPHMRWDILKDFEPVSLVATVEWGLIANNHTSYKTAADLIAAAKAAPARSTIVRAVPAARSIWRWRCSLRRPAYR